MDHEGYLIVPSSQLEITHLEWGRMNGPGRTKEVALNFHFQLISFHLFVQLGELSLTAGFSGNFLGLVCVGRGGGPCATQTSLHPLPAPHPPGLPGKEEMKPDLGRNVAPGQG